MKNRLLGKLIGAAITIGAGCVLTFFGIYLFTELWTLVASGLAIIIAGLSILNSREKLLDKKK